MDLIEKVVDVSKRRGFIFPSSEIYGGMANTYDFGPYGTSLKENIRRIWWDKFVEDREDIYGIDSSIIINPKVWEASGHVANFGDVMVEDTKNHKRYRADHLIEEHFEKKGKNIKVDGKTAEELNEIILSEKIKSPDGNNLSKARKFNLLFRTEIGIIEGEGATAYLRGEIAQGLFINFKNILDSIHPKLPFGIAQTGKAFRNEITKGQFTFRTLEFDLMEFEYFFDPEADDWNKLFDQWKIKMDEFAKEIGLDSSKLRWRAHEEFELSHYSKRTEDLEYEFPWGFKEMFGIAYRTDFGMKILVADAPSALSISREISAFPSRSPRSWRTRSRSSDACSSMRLACPRTISTGRSDASLLQLARPRSTRPRAVSLSAARSLCNS